MDSYNKCFRTHDIDSSNEILKLALCNIQIPGEKIFQLRKFFFIFTIANSMTYLLTVLLLLNFNGFKIQATILQMEFLE